MAANFKKVTLSCVIDRGEIVRKYNGLVTVQVCDEQDNLLLRVKENELGPFDQLDNLLIYKDTDMAKFGRNGCVMSDDNNSTLLQFAGESDLNRFLKLVRDFKSGRRDSIFAQRTDDASASQYFQFYGYLSQQQNMMQDYIRTSTYQRAIISNSDDFRDKVVLDVGAGSGILSFFALQAGARKVYAVEASSMAKHAEQLVYNNKAQGRIEVIPGKIEEITLPERVDVIISEPMGYMLFNERMLETYLHAKKWLNPNGRMFPSRGDLHIVPFSDSSLYMEQLNKANFWYQENFHGVDLSSLRTAAVKEYFRQPVVDTFDVRICMAKSHRYTVDFLAARESDLHRIEIPVSFVMLQSGEIHGLAYWFDVAFLGSTQTVWLSTAPTQPLTHWYQVRCLIDTPLFVHRGQSLSGTVVLISNKRQSYDVEIDIYLEGTGSRATNSLDLKNPYFRYTGQAPQPPPGTQETSPSEQYWHQLDQQHPATNNITNGVVVMNGNSAVTSGTLIDPSLASLTHQHSNMILGVHPTPVINLGSLPSPGATQTNRSSPHSRVNNSSIPTSSIGGGISPSLFSNNTPVNVMNTNTFPVNNSLMIGDYVTPGNIILPGSNISYKQH